MNWHWWARLRSCMPRPPKKNQDSTPFSRRLGSWTPSVRSAEAKCPAWSAWTIAPTRASACLFSVKADSAPVVHWNSRCRTASTPSGTSWRKPVSLSMSQYPAVRPATSTTSTSSAKVIATNWSTFRRKLWLCAAFCEATKSSPFTFPFTWPCLDLLFQRSFCKESYGWKLWYIAGSPSARSSLT